MSLESELLPSANSRTAEGSLYLLYKRKPLCHTNHSFVVHYPLRNAHTAIHPSNRTAHGSVSVLNPHYVAKSPTSQGRGQGCARRYRYCPKGWTILRTPMLVLSDCKNEKIAVHGCIVLVQGALGKGTPSGRWTLAGMLYMEEVVTTKPTQASFQRIRSASSSSLNILIRRCHRRNDGGESPA